MGSSFAFGPFDFWDPLGCLTLLFVLPALHLPAASGHDVPVSLKLLLDVVTASQAY